MIPHESLAEILRIHGQSVTVARQQVFSALQNQEPLTMHALIDKLPSIDRASVYRTVALFDRLGIVQRLQSGWKYTLELSDAYHDHHHHATCTVCGRSFVLPENDELEKHLGGLVSKIGFHIQRHQIEIQGICKNCLDTEDF